MRRALFGFTLFSLFALIPTLVWFGTRAALKADRGQAASGVVDPDAPGYQALVTPTPTLLLLQVDAASRLVGVTMLATGGDVGGGSVLFIPTRLLVETDGAARARPLTEVQAAGGSEATAAALRKAFRLGFDSVVTVDPARWAQLLAPVAPLVIDNSDELVRVGPDGEQRVAFEAGKMALTAENAADYLALTNPDEQNEAHLYRHELFWRAWLTAVAARGANSVPGEASSGLGSFVRGIAGGVTQFVPLPVSASEPLEASSDGVAPVTDYRLASTGLAELLADLVPFPTAGVPGDRMKVRLLDGCGHRQTALDAAVVLVPLGAEITVFGNADRLDCAPSIVRYYNPTRRADAELLARSIGAGQPELQEQQTDTVDVTVIIGRDISPTETK